MLITLSADAPSSTRTTLLALALERGLHIQAMDNGRGGEVLGVVGALAIDHLDLAGIEHIQPVHKPFMMASKEARERSVVMVGDVAIGGGGPVIMAGPCSIESIADQIEQGKAVKAAGANILRGGAFKPRSSPYSFQGLGEDGLKALAAARDVTGLPVVTEVMEPDQVDLVASYVDMLQIGSRNMANFSLLKRVGKTNIPVLLKRGFSATQEEFLMSAEYIMAGGNTNVVLCERGIRAFDAAFRFSLDLNVIPSIKELSHLPIIVDPSHGTGRRSLVGRMAMAGMAAGADGLMLEVHPDPDSALSDGYQTITPRELAHIRHRMELLMRALHGFDGGDADLDDSAALTGMLDRMESAETRLEAIA